MKARVYENMNQYGHVNYLGDTEHELREITEGDIVQVKGIYYKVEKVYFIFGNVYLKEIDDLTGNLLSSYEIIVER